MPELSALRIFLAVTEERGFAAAARRLGVTPASVTRAVAGLEAELGVQLLLRTTRRVTPTAAGAIYAAQVAPLVVQLDEVTDAVRQTEGILSGLLRISAPLAVGTRLLPDVLSQFRILHPQTRVALHLDDRFVDILTEGFDLAIRISGPQPGVSTIWRKLCPVPLVLVASPGCLAAHGLSDGPHDPDDLEPLPRLAHASDGHGETWELRRGDLRRSLRAGATFSANNGDLLARMVLNGDGVAMLPRFLVADELAAGRMVQVLPDWRLPDLWLTLFYPPYDHLPPRVRMFSDFFEACLARGAPLV